MSADWKPKAEPDEQEVCLARQAERQDRYHQMMQWYKQRLPTSDIAHRLGVTTRTVQNWIKKGIPYEKPRRKRRIYVDFYAETAIALLQGGLPSSLQVWHALRAQGFKGSYPRDAQRDAYVAEMALRAHSMLPISSGRNAEIPLPSQSYRAMEDAVKPMNR